MRRAGIDWDSVRSRLRASEHALDEAMAETPARIEAAYRERAIRLAQTHADPKRAADWLSVLVFRLAAERYAIELKELAEVVPFVRCARAPGTPPHFLGVINLRGEIRAAVNLGRLLGLYENAEQVSGFVLVVRRPGREIGLRVDSVEDLREIREQEFTPSAQTKYARGLTAGPLTLLDLDAVLAEALEEGS
jgi:purine-binding chemotaxis protein CheW